MTAHDRTLADAAQRALAIAAHERSMIVEAGAGSGKTALMSGRIALMLASGVAPGAIAAVSFTELAASELLERVGDVVAHLLAGEVPEELRLALPHGLSPLQGANLAEAEARLDELVCTTIHGFCQRLVKPYPVEADIDPGARVADEAEADGIFRDLLDEWLRECLSGGGGLVAEMVLADPVAAKDAVDRVAECLREGRTVGTRPAEPLPHSTEAFRGRVTAFADFVRACPVAEQETASALLAFQAMAERVRHLDGNDDATVVSLLTSEPEPSLCTKDGGFASYRGGKGKWAAAAKAVGIPKVEADLFHEALHRWARQACRGVPDGWPSRPQEACRRFDSEQVVGRCRVCGVGDHGGLRSEAAGLCRAAGQATVVRVRERVKSRVPEGRMRRRAKVMAACRTSFRGRTEVLTGGRENSW